MAKALSSVVNSPPLAGTERGAAEEGPGLWPAAGAAMREDGLPDEGGCGGAGARAGAAAAAVAMVGGGAPAVSVGNLIVGADVGFGGKLIRTVSFLG
jgi:hypothetical protein